MKENNIGHQGIVIKTSEDCVFVRIEAQSACAACHAKNMCNLTDVQEKIIEVPYNGSRKFSPGEQVTVFMKQSQGTRAIVLGYLIPFLILFIALFVIAHFTGDEATAGLSALLLLAPYYLGLYLFRNRMKRSFGFELK